MAVSEDGGKSWVPLSKFAESAMDEDDKTSTEEYLFLQGQLDLFGVLCNGRNEYRYASTHSRTLSHTNTRTYAHAHTHTHTHTHTLTHTCARAHTHTASSSSPRRRGTSHGTSALPVRDRRICRGASNPSAHSTYTEIILIHPACLCFCASRDPHSLHLLS
jgi:hypothetical protein